jgi:HEAT repeat protein
MECLHVVGRDAREQVEARLHDRRWFFVRNLVILLRGMEDPDVLKPLGRLVGYANPTVQFEVMRTFIHFKDPRADRYLLKELESRDPAVLLQAARLAANSSNPEVASKLSEVLNRKFLKEADENIKSAVIKALAEMALPEALPGLRQFLQSRGLLKSFQSNSMKIEAVKSLGRYDCQDAVDLAEEVYRKASGELARAAGQVCMQKRGTLPWT